MGAKSTIGSIRDLSSLTAFTANYLEDYQNRAPRPALRSLEIPLGRANRDGSQIVIQI
jgi:hypothetical protein